MDKHKHRTAAVIASDITASHKDPRTVSVILWTASNYAISFQPWSGEIVIRRKRKDGRYVCLALAEAPKYVREAYRVASAHLASAQSDDALASQGRQRPTLRAFARGVQTRADRLRGAARFGDDKAYLVSVWRSLRTEPDGTLDGLDGLDDFKQRLLEAHRRRLVRLERADLVQRMDRALVSESEVQYLNARFHFLQSPRREKS